MKKQQANKKKKQIYFDKYISRVLHNSRNIRIMNIIYK